MLIDEAREQLRKADDGGRGLNLTRRAWAYILTLAVVSYIAAIWLSPRVGEAAAWLIVLVFGGMLAVATANLELRMLRRTLRRQISDWESTHRNTQ